ncbi:MAG: NAD(P)H-dependent oxidoreductase [Methanomassiliicoccaceae archaeon]|jgi:multimeric flavodoxin WrbA|nr:NAD(P)H-dependent oxidoreductase [Methanomassiliicoccaceae archaeon]
MKVSIFNGSPKKDGETAAVTSVLKDIAKVRGADADEHFLYHMGIRGCLTCGYGPGRENAMKMIAAFISSDLPVLACPIIMWRISDSLNALIDLMYHVCRYDDETMERIAGKRVAIVLTADDGGAAVTDATELLRRFCGLLGMEVAGVLTVTHAPAEDMNAPASIEKIRSFAEMILG